MYQKASELETLVEKLDSVLTQAAEIVKRTDSYWVGDAAEIVRTEAREGVKLAENNHKNLTREIENLRTYNGTISFCGKEKFRRFFTASVINFNIRRICVG